MRQTTRTTLGSVYIRTVQAGGLLILALAVGDVSIHPPGWAWVLLTALTALTGTYAVKIPGVVVRLSVSEPIVFLATLMFGPAPGTLTAAVDALVMSLRLPPRLRTPHRLLFNVGALAITVLPSAFLYFSIAGLDIRSPQYGPLDTFVGPLYLFALCVFLFNSGLVAIAVSVERGLSAFFVWRSQFLWLSASYLASAAIAAILVVFTNTVDLALAGVLLPLVVVSFLAVRTTLGRLDDTNKHLSEVHSLYLSTIETLAMAIDAKDQVTHGHIRRVQRYAVALARSLGVSDERQIRAIEAAALLHDMGKLAIPEFILNKPGKLTTREFSVMKTHAAVGADLLSSIQFPYPVVPIVRHHHENWDGSGYPDGIKGSDIPIGARILSVVDCYDALTSDRPYRPAMTAEEALEILSQRRGKMYDPLIVDAFVREHSRLRAESELQDLPAVILANQVDSPHSGQMQGEPAATQAAPVESLRLLANLAPFPDGSPINTVCRQLVNSIRAIASFDTLAIYVIDDVSSDAVSIYVEGAGGRALSSTRVPIAERMTGWVAAHRTAVWNTDAALDLANAASGVNLALGSSLPLCCGEAMIGVLSLYGRADQEITVAQRRALESLLPTISSALFSALQRPSASIDCTSPAVRAAALTAVDALLAHDRLALDGSHHATVLAISVAPVGSDVNRPVDIDTALAELCSRLSPHLTAQRCVLRITHKQLLLCAFDGTTSDQLASEVILATSARAMHSLVVSWSRIDNPLELQDRVRRMLETTTPEQSRSGADLVH